MAKMSVRTTFALDPQTAAALDHLALRWGVSKSEALRRAVQVAAVVEESDRSDAMAALAELRERLGLDEEKADRWIAEIRAERRASRP